MKNRRRYAGQRHEQSRRWHVLPPLIHGPEPLEGGDVLQDWDDALGTVLWQASRDVTLWATAHPEARAEIFSDTSPDYDHERRLLRPDDTDERLWSGLRLLRQMTQQPTSIRADQVARVCRRLSEWANEQGKLATALAFAQNGALASSGDAAAAFWVATIAVRMNDHARAEVWFRRAIGLARQSRNWRMYSRSFGGLGNLYRRRGNLPAARRLHTRALRGARRGGMRREQAAALHDLLAVAIEAGATEQVDDLARQALDAYGPGTRRIHVLAHDLAYFWMELGCFERALPVFQAVLPLIERPVERLFVFADIARAAGGVGDASTAHMAAEKVWELSTEPELRRGAGRALLEVGHGYLSLCEKQKAAEAAREALASATVYHESKIRFAAEALLECIAKQINSTSPGITIPADVDVSIADQLAADLVRTLEAMAAGGD